MDKGAIAEGRTLVFDSCTRGLKTNQFLVRDVSMSTEYEYLLAAPEVIGQYVEKWMAVVGKEVVAVGASAKEVLDKARQLHPDKEPFIAKFPKETAMLL